MRRSRAKPPSPFRYFNSSPEVIRLVVLMDVRFPLSLLNVKDLLFERGDRHLPRDGAALVEQVRSHVRWRDQAAAGEPDARVPATGDGTSTRCT